MTPRQSEAASAFSELLQRQRRRDRRRLALLALLLLAALVLGLSAGEVWLWPTQWFTPDGQLFVGQLRLPRMSARRWRSAGP